MTQDLKSITPGLASRVIPLADLPAIFARVVREEFGFDPVLLVYGSEKTPLGVYSMEAPADKQAAWSEVELFENPYEAARWLLSELFGEGVCTEIINLGGKPCVLIATPGEVRENAVSAVG